MSIKINTISKPVVPGEKYTYKDLHLDIAVSYTKNREANKINEVNDVSADYDIMAIKNSIFNLFTTIPGQKILSPEYGLNLVQFLFSGITTINAQLIGETIQQGISRWEPRISINDIEIQKNEDAHLYTITLNIFIPILKKGLSLKGILNNSGFYYV